MIGVPSADEVMRAVAEGRATWASLPLPDEDDPAPWWPKLAGGERRAPARRRAAAVRHRGNAADAYGATLSSSRAMEPEASGDDCSLLVDRRARTLCCAAVIAVRCSRRNSTAIRRRCRGRQLALAHLVEVDGAPAATASRGSTARWRRSADASRAAWLGAYARPLPDAALDGVAPE